MHGVGHFLADDVQARSYVHSKSGVKAEGEGPVKKKMKVFVRTAGVTPYEGIEADMGPRRG